MGIDVQINGAFGIDFTHLKDSQSNNFKGIHSLSKQLLKHGCTSYCPTVITSAPVTYRKSLKRINQYMTYQEKLREHSLRRASWSTILWKDAHANALGMHLEGPFISIKGAHPEHLLRIPHEGYKSVSECYGPLDGVKIVTIAPELPGAAEAIHELTEQGIVCSLGHSKSDIQEGILGIKAGGRMMTHLFNAMQPFHHRDPGLVGLLGLSEYHSNFFYGMIADGIHAHPASLNIARTTHGKGAILVTDAMEAMGLPSGRYSLGTLEVDIQGFRATVAGTNTLAGATTSLDQCVRNFREYTKCSIVEAVGTATLHPAQMLGIENKKGSLKPGCDADVILLDDDLNVHGCFVNGQLAWANPNRITIIPQNANL